MGLQSTPHMLACFRPPPRGAAAARPRRPCGCPDRIEAEALRRRRARLDAEWDAWERAGRVPRDGTSKAPDFQSLEPPTATTATSP